MSKNPIVHIEFSAADPQAAADFYQNLFDWDVRHMPEMEYYTFESEPNRGGGFPKVDHEVFKAGDVVVYIQTEDIPSMLTKIETHGGKTLMPETEIPGTGSYAFFADPTGNRVGLFTPLGDE
jgi:hypothetical protein